MTLVNGEKKQQKIHEEKSFLRFYYQISNKCPNL